MVKQKKRATDALGLTAADLARLEITIRQARKSGVTLGRAAAMILRTLPAEVVEKSRLLDLARYVESAWNRAN